MSQFYYYLWALYVMAGIGLLYLSWRLFRSIKVPEVVMALVALVAALLFTPAKLIAEQTDLTPALMLVVFDGLTLGWPSAWGGLKYILLVYAGLLILLVPVCIVRNKVVAKRSSIEAVEE